MKRSSLMILALVALLAAGLTVVAAPAGAFHDGGEVLLVSHHYTWEDPESGGTVEVTVNVYEGCTTPRGEFIPHDMTFEYVVDNLDFDPEPGFTNGFSGFQVLFPQAVPELYNQQSPAVGGPWQQNAFSGQSPPWGVEWDVPLPDMGIMPGETGVFSFCTYERTDELIGAPEAGWFHTWGLTIPEPIVDADGSLTRFDGVPTSVEVAVLDPLSTWPTGFYQEGLDMFDSDGSGSWTAGDDLHVEDPTTHPGAIRDGTHDDGLDPLVLDLDDSLDTTPGNEPVSCDMESGSFCAPGFPWGLAFFDSLNPNGFWDDGEDIVLDLNGDLVFGEVVNTQTYITYVPNAVPGKRFYDLELDACSVGHKICKKVKYIDEQGDGDGIIEVGEPVLFLEVIQVHNPSSKTWRHVIVRDRWGAEIDVMEAVPSQGTATLTTKGRSEKEFLKWHIGALSPGETANLVMRTTTDRNPAGHQEYTSPGEYEYNSGAVLKFRVYRDGARKWHQKSFETGSIGLEVFP